MPRIDALLENRIDAVFGRFWSSASCDNADYIYRLKTGKCFRFPDIYKCVTHFEYCELTNDHALCKPVQSQVEFYRKNLFAATITDVLVSADPELRSPDEFILALSSGLYLFQESGNFTGCGTRYGLTDRSGGFPLVSVFTTPEWAALNK